LFFAIILLSAGGYFVFFQKNGEPAAIYQKEQVASVSSVAQDMDKDTDNDGLKDWEEILWGTDPNNPDTNGNGIKDGDEIKGLRAAAKTDPVTPSENAEKVITLTDAIGQTFVGELTAKKNNNQEITRNDLNELVESVFGVLQNFSEETYKYSPENLKTFAANTEEIKTYANKLAVIIKKEFDPIPEDEMDIFNAALSQEEPERLEELETLSTAYKNVSLAALNLEVPDNLKNFHLAVINGFDLISENLIAMGEVFSDTMTGWLGFQNYTKNVQTAYNALNDINKYLADNKITFSSSEPANIFALYTKLNNAQ